ncbi:Mor transcription activator family protein [Bacterioplanes sanyensis]|uniref:Mor transcription activator family protein n=1 Tax=Bacterioplanes sanyensis TaxID=1249553 RepID=UPI0012FE14E0|nr:Mor transcription activator family protein [Bacterioplanes sanyensis]
MTEKVPSIGHWAEHINNLSEADKKQWARDYCAIADVYIRTLLTMGYDDTAADKLTQALLAELTSYCGGRHIYFPKRDRLDSSLRDDALFRDWSELGVKPCDLAEKYGISRTHVYRVINKKRAAKRARAH